MQNISIIALRIVPPFGLMDVWHITHFGWILYQSCIHFWCALNTQSQFSWLCIRRFSSSRQIIQWSAIFTIEETGRVDSILSKKLGFKFFRSHDWDTIQYRKLCFVRDIVFRFDDQYKRRLFYIIVELRSILVQRINDFFITYFRHYDFFAVQRMLNYRLD